MIVNTEAGRKIQVEVGGSCLACSSKSYELLFLLILEILETFGPRCPDIDDMSKNKSPFPLLQLGMEQFVGFVKLSPRFFIPLSRFLLSANKIAAVNCFKPGILDLHISKP
jgi:hypothetical protein